MFDTIDFFREMGFGPNSFALGVITSPSQLDIRNLPLDALKLLEQLLKDRLAMKHGYLLEDGYRVLINHLRRSYTAKPTDSIAYLRELDARRGLDSRKIFKDFYQLMEEN